MPAAASAWRFRGTRAKRVEADRIVRVGHIEVAHLVCPLGRDGIDNRFRQVAVRVDDGDPFPADDVVHGQVEQDGAFARAGFADNIEVALALLARERYTAADRGRCDDGWLRLHKSGAASGAKRFARGGALATGRPTCCGVAVGGGPPGVPGVALPARYAEAVPDCRAEFPSRIISCDNAKQGVDSELYLCRGWNVPGTPPAPQPRSRRRP